MPASVAAAPASAAAAAAGASEASNPAAAGAGASAAAPAAAADKEVRHPDLASETRAAVRAAFERTEGQLPASDKPQADTSRSGASLTPDAASAAGAAAAEPASAGNTDDPTRQGDAAAAGTDDPTKAPPQEKWPAILDNARATGRKDAIAAYGIPANADPARIRSFVSLLDSDPIGLYHRLGRELAPYLQEHPDPAAAQPAASKKFERPVATLRAESGEPAYNQAAIDQMFDHLEGLYQRLSGQVAPMGEHVSAIVEREMELNANRTAETVLGEAQEWDGFKELAPQIAEMMQADGRVTLVSAYNRLYQPWLKEKRAAEDRKRATTEAELRGKIIKELQTAPRPADTLAPGAPVRGAKPAQRGGSLENDVRSAVQAAFSKHSQ